MHLRCILCLLLSMVLFNLVSQVECELEPLPPDPDYKAADVEYDDGGMGPLFDFARSFINTALPGGFPKDFIEGIINGGPTDIISLAKQLLDMFKGYVAAIVVGLLFILIVPLVGLCFCCCRLCGNCGGDNKQAETDNLHCWRRILSAIVFVLSIFALVGAICTFVSNNRMTTSLDKVGDIVNNNLDDIDTFLDHIIDQVDVIGGTNLNKTQVAINDALDKDKLQNDISAFVVNDLGNGTLDKLDSNLKSVVKAFDDVTANLETVKNAAATCGPPTCFDPSSMLKLDEAAFTTFKNDDTVAKVKKEISKSVQLPTNMITLQAEANKAFDDIKHQVEDIRTKMNDFKTNADDGINIQSYKDSAQTYVDDAKKYDNYRHIAGAVLGSMITLIVVLQFLGLTFGFVGQGFKTSPEHRGCISNTGGNMLIASVAFIFIFSWLLMLLTTLSFAVGAILERFVCQPLSPPDFELIQVAESQMNVSATLGAPLGTILRDCKNNKPAYEAFRLESTLNFTEIEKEMDHQQQEIATQMETALSSLNNLNTGNSVTEAGNSLDHLKTILDGIDFNGFDTKLALVPQNPKDYYEAIHKLSASLNHLKQLSSKIPTWKSGFLSDLKTVQTNITAKTGDVVNKFQAKIVDIGWEYLNTTKRQVRHELGKCSPLWNLYDSVMLVSFCSYIVDAFNGFWFSIGWCLFFFVPSIVFSVKLAKYYRYVNKVCPSDDVPLQGY
ncbi:hypothetical protein ACF0H5_008644 [Mactra antiquata]